MLVGIVGKPSAGKSTFLNALCNANIAKTGNYPFVTLKPNVGVGYAFIPCICKEMGITCGKCYETSNLRPVPVKVLDVPGLVPGAHEGRGLGNEFLSDLSEADIFLHIIDISGSLNAEGEEVPMGSYDPLKDVAMLEEEIIQWIAGILENGWDKVKRTTRSTRIPLEEVLAERLTGLKINRLHIKKALNNDALNFPAKIDDWGNTELLKLAHEVYKIAKPMIIVANKIDKPTSAENLERLKKQYPTTKIVPASALAEIALQTFHKAGKIDYDPLSGSITSKNITDKEKNTIEKIQKEILDVYHTTGIPNILTEAVEMLDYIAIFPVADIHKLTDHDGNILPDVRLVPKGTTTKEFAGFIHKDLFDNFVCGIDARTNKRLSDTHELQHRDIIRIMSSK